MEISRFVDAQLSKMKQEHVITIIIAFSDKIDTVWSIFISVHLGILALMIIYNQEFQLMRAYQRFITLIAYYGFMAFNYSGIVGAYTGLDIFHSQLKTIYDTREERLFSVNTQVYDFFINATFASRLSHLSIVYGFAVLAVSALLLQPLLQRPLENFFRSKRSSNAKILDKISHKDLVHRCNNKKDL